MLTTRKPPVRSQPSNPQTQPSKPQLSPPTPQRLIEDHSGHEEEIRPLAYRKWQEAGCPVGDGIEFWLAAETEILRRKPRRTRLTARFITPGVRPGPNNRPHDRVAAGRSIRTHPQGARRRVA